MNDVELILAPISGNLKSMNRNPVEGWYELEVAIPKNWVFNENDDIGVTVIHESDVGKLLNIYPKNRNIVVDDLILFVVVVINTNKKIADKELEFKNQMEEMKKGLEQKASEFFKELDELKENSFKRLSDNFANELGEAKKAKRGRPKTIISNNIEPELSTSPKKVDLNALAK